MERYARRRLVFMRPFIFRKKSVHHFFHREILNQLVLSEFNASHWIEMTDTCQMLFDVLSFVCYARRRYNWIDENFKTNFSAQIVGHITFLSTNRTNNKLIIAIAIMQFLVDLLDVSHPVLQTYYSLRSDGFPVQERVNHSLFVSMFIEM